LAPVLQPDREALIEKENLAVGKVGIVEEQVAGLSSSTGQDSRTVTGSEWVAERKEEDFVEEIEMEKPGCEGLSLLDRWQKMEFRVFSTKV
jgi:hypothetical protein